jgi:hypothetical protein
MLEKDVVFFKMWQWGDVDGLEPKGRNSTASHRMTCVWYVVVDNNNNWSILRLGSTVYNIPTDSTTGYSSTSLASLST